MFVTPAHSRERNFCPIASCCWGRGIYYLANSEFKAPNVVVEEHWWTSHQVAPEKRKQSIACHLVTCSPVSYVVFEWKSPR